MGLLGKLFGKSAAPQTWPAAPGPITEWPRDGIDMQMNVQVVLFDPAAKMVQVVGEGSYQGTLERLAGGRTVDGGRDRDHKALLLPEPTNPYDPNAVRVVVVTADGTGATIGYLSRENAVSYRPVIDRVARIGKVAACLASVSGGWDRGTDDRGNFGVRLSVGTPEALMKELDEAGI